MHRGEREVNCGGVGEKEKEKVGGELRFPWVDGNCKIPKPPKLARSSCSPTCSERTELLKGHQQASWDPYFRPEGEKICLPNHPAL